MYVTSQTKNTRPMFFQGDDIYFLYRFYNNTLSRIITNTYYLYYYRQISFFIYIKIQISTNSNIFMVIFSLIRSLLCIYCLLQPFNLPTYEESVFRQLKRLCVRLPIPIQSSFRLLESEYAAKPLIVYFSSYISKSIRDYFVAE